ncbi:MAG: hypothetical protein LBQ02_02170 [Candidatus Nomurabacteria bacterium]|jgi:hypothetical protein|nr:hypothetical protein [Candidatus Nomurabacteria bacterium]
MDMEQQVATAPQAAIIKWEGQEFVVHNRGKGWMAVFVAITLALIGLSIFLQAWTFTALIVVSAVAVVVYIRRPARIIRYALNNDGIMAGEDFHDFAEFKHFGVIQDGAHYFIMLVPTKRFKPAVTLYFPEAVGEKLVDELGARLPMEDLKLDAIDRLLRKLRI